MGDSDTGADGEDGTVGVSTHRLTIEDDLLERAEDAYPASATKRELVRRVFEKGVCAREDELENSHRNSH